MMNANQTAALDRFNACRQAMLREWGTFVTTGAIDHATSLQEIRATSTCMAGLVALYEEELLDE